MTTEEMQKQIESMMPTPKQIVENIDKELEEKRKRVFEKEERYLRRRIIFNVIGWILELFIVGSVIYLLFKQCS